VGARLFVDAVHFAPHRLIDVKAWDCDFLACSAYKFYGPHLGILFVKDELLGRLAFPKLIPAPEYGPERAEPGTQNHEGIAGAAAAVDFIASFSEAPGRRERLAHAFDILDCRGAALTGRLWQAIAATKGAHLYGPPPGTARTPTIAFTLENKSCIDAARALADQGLFLSHGDFYASTVIERLGRSPDGVIRAGCACYTTSEEIDRLATAIGVIAENSDET
jgi:selenocysteine lyase/cysteine desulfurase